MDINDFQDIDELKLYLKNLLVQDPDGALDELASVLGKKKFSDTILFKARTKSLKEDTFSGLIDDDKKRVLNAQLVHSLTGYIDGLKDRHFKKDVLDHYKKKDISTDDNSKERLPTLPVKPNPNIKPVVALLIFANDMDDPLGNLKTEEKEIQKALLHFKQAAGGNLEIINISSVDEVFEYFNLYKGQIGLVHYGGHASGNGLHIDGAVAQAQGLANLMGQEPNLRFVFLNGCATKDQVKLLQENKVQAVIATSVPINDKKATDFAVRFYQNLTYFNGKNTLEDAFKFAKAYIETTETTPMDVQTRGYIFDDVEPIDTFNWGFYEHPDFPDGSEWHLPKIGVEVSDTNGKSSNPTTVTEKPTPEPTPPKTELSEIERDSLIQQKTILEKKIAYFENKLLEGGEGPDKEFYMMEQIDKMKQQLKEINDKLG